MLEGPCSSVTALGQHLGFFFLLVGIEDYSDQKSDICSVSGCQKIRVEFAVAVLVVIIALQFYH